MFRDDETIWLSRNEKIRISRFLTRVFWQDSRGIYETTLDLLLLGAGGSIKSRSKRIEIIRSCDAVLLRVIRNVQSIAVCYIYRQRVKVSLKRNEGCLTTCAGN